MSWPRKLVLSHWDKHKDFYFKASLHKQKLLQGINLLFQKIDALKGPSPG